ncbi:MAG: hypothetical protein JJU11_11695 [Candidatus Sumerlaeia bacterium]|nr:hypothetical protein [Candidatus Sumerlaeia bacterium]
MTLHTRLVLAGGLALATILPLHDASAHELAVPGRSPANPLAILSVPDATSAWEKLSQTPLRSALDDFFTSSPAASDPAFSSWNEQIKAAGEGLGFSLLPDDLFLHTISGFDLYAINPGGIPSIVGVFAFHDGTAPGKILDQLKREARNAGGTSGGYTADTVQERDSNGRKILELPAFSLYFSSSANILIISSDRSALDSAAADQGRVTFSADFFDRFNAGLEGAPADIWFFGEPLSMLPLALRGWLNPELFAPDPEIQRSSIARIAIVEDSILMTTFMPHQDMEISQQRLARAAPASSTLPNLGSFHQPGVFHFASNYFDGLAALDTILENLTSVPGVTVDKVEVKNQISGSTTLLGFDLQNDLLANLGPKAALLVTEIGTDPGRPVWSQAKGALLMGVRDEILFEEVLGIFEESSSAPATATREAVSFIKEAESEHGDYKYFDVNILAELDLVPSYKMTSEGDFLVTTNRSIMEAILAVRAGEKTSLLDLNDYKATLGKLDDTRNILYHLDTPKLLEIFRATMDIRDKTEEDARLTNAVIDLFKVLSGYTVSTKYTADGRQIQYLLKM